MKPRKIVVKGALRASLRDPFGTLDHESCRGFSGRRSEGWPRPIASREESCFRAAGSTSSQHAEL